jgi:DNA (cytosine-5)-methyltransferase 1
MSYCAIELCAGGGGQALGLEMAGFHHAAAVEYEPQYCTTLRKNRPQWNVLQQDIRGLRCEDFSDIDLIAAGVPCPPFSIAGKQLGADDERDMLPAVVTIIDRIRPRAVLLENVPDRMELALTNLFDRLLNPRHSEVLAVTVDGVYVL